MAEMAGRSWAIGSPLIRTFVATFVGVWAIFGCLHALGIDQPFVYLVCRNVAAAAGWLLAMFGSEFEVLGNVIRTPLGSVGVGEECSAVEIMELLAAAMIAYPAPLGRRVIGVLVMVPCILTVNVIRVASLVIMLSYDSAWFDFSHTVLWQGILILTTAAYWIVWTASTAKLPMAAPKPG